MGNSVTKTERQITLVHDKIGNNFVKNVQGCDEIKPGDHIISINNYKIKGISVTEVRKFITSDKLYILLKRYNKEIKLVLDDVNINHKYDLFNNICGVGVVFRKDSNKNTYVHDILEGCPLDRDNKVEIGDFLLSIDDVDVYNESIQDIPKHIIGKEGTKVLLKFSRKSALFTVELIREKLYGNDPPISPPLIDLPIGIKINDIPISSRLNDLIHINKSIDCDDTYEMVDIPIVYPVLV
jgi:C-terminal processing protease CtpA/Prc